MASRPRKPARRSTRIVDARFYARLDRLTDSMSYAEIGKLTQTHPETVRRFVQGGSRPTFEWAAQLCRARGVSLDWLAYGRGVGPLRW